MKIIPKCMMWPFAGFSRGCEAGLIGQLSQKITGNTISGTSDGDDTMMMIHDVNLPAGL